MLLCLRIQQFIPLIPSHGWASTTPTNPNDPAVSEGDNTQVGQKVRDDIYQFLVKWHSNEIRKKYTVQAVSKSLIACYLNSGLRSHWNHHESPTTFCGKAAFWSQCYQVPRKTFPGSVPWSGNPDKTAVECGKASRSLGTPQTERTCFWESHSHQTLAPFSHPQSESLLQNLWE